jgi:hypothetical protein
MKIKLNLGGMLYALFTPWKRHRKAKPRPDFKDRIIKCQDESMLPTFPKKANLWAEMKPFEELEEGMVVVLWDKYRGFSVIHRILGEHKPGAWITKGDNNSRPDDVRLTPESYAGTITVNLDNLHRQPDGKWGL